MPAVKPLEKIPGLAPEAERATKEAINALVAEVQRLARLTRVTPLKTSSYSATEGDIVRVRGGVPVALPRARAENQGAQIHILVESLGGVRVTARDSTLNGITAANLTAVGMYEFESNGAGGWFSVVGAGGATNGITGATGAAGTAGSQGVKGDQGAPGQDGQDGADGPPGLNGIQGVKGDPGPPGQDGVDGQDGAPGPAGAAGTAGAPGATGSMGPPGMDGEKGDQGDPGPPGTSGGAGATPGWDSVLAVFPGSGANSPLVQAGQALLFDGGTAAGDIQVTNAFKLVTFGGNIALSTAFAAADITLNTVGGIAIQAGATPITSVTGNDVIVAADADIRLGAASGVNITAGSAAAGAADPGDVVVNATNQFVVAAGIPAIVGSGVGIRLDTLASLTGLAETGGMALEAGFPTSISPGAGDIVQNATSGIRIAAGATQAVAAVGLHMSADVDILMRSTGGGVSIDANFPTQIAVGTGDIVANATSGILLNAAATQVVAVSGISLITDAAAGAINIASGTSVAISSLASNDIALNAARHVLCNPAGGGSTTKTSKGLALGSGGSSYAVAAGEVELQSNSGVTPGILVMKNDLDSWNVGYSAFGASLLTPTAAALTTGGVVLVSRIIAASSLPAGACFEAYAHVRVTRGATATALVPNLTFRTSATNLFVMSGAALNVTAAFVGDMWIRCHLSVLAAPAAAAQCGVTAFSANNTGLAATINETPMTGVPGGGGAGVINPTLPTNAAITLQLYVNASVTVANVTYTPVMAYIRRIS